jgi:predicted MFS family arabinose efflux permease
VPLCDFSRRQQLALVLVAATFTLWSTEMFAMLTWLPQYLVEARDLGAESTILAYAIPSILILIFSIASGFLLRAGAPLAPVLALSLAFQAAVWFVLPYLNSSTLGLAGLVVFGVAAGISAAFLFAAPALILGAENAGGSAFGVVMTGRNLGVLLGPILLPPVLLTMGSWQAVSQVFGGVSLAGALTAGALGAMLARRDCAR